MLTLGEVAGWGVLKTIDVYDDGIRLGHIGVSMYPKTGFGVVHYNLKSEFFGKGYGNQIHDLGEAYIIAQGLTPHIAPMLSYRAWRMWMKRDPSRLAEHPSPQREGETIFSTLAYERIGGY